jgi:RNA polymerase subunit RPABC4/transcription elongation factor Spt4
MNQRILELAEQAGMYIVDDEFSSGGRFAEKFAKLIVQKCIEVCEHHPSRILSNNWYGEKVALDIASRLEVLFGVNE